MTSQFKRSRDYERKVLRMLGDPSAVDRELREFGKSARILSSRQKHLIASYAKQWVGMVSGRVVANAPTLKAVVAQLDRLGVPRGRALVRYIDKNPRKMIL
jgi:hypothetical protein